MYELIDFLFTPTVGSSLTLTNVLLTIALSLVAGIITALGYILVNRKDGWSAHFVTSLVVLPSVIAIIIMMIGSNIARAFSLGGVFALIRFRSEPGNPRDITYVCVTMAAGLACGTGYVGYGIIFVVLISLVFWIIGLAGAGIRRNPTLVLKITIPEDVDFESAFEPVFKKYTKYHRLDRIKTADFGALFQLQYNTSLIDQSKRREFIDELRVVNSNLNIVMSTLTYEEGRKTF